MGASVPERVRVWSTFKMRCECCLLCSIVGSRTPLKCMYAMRMDINPGPCHVAFKTGSVSNAASTENAKISSVAYVLSLIPCCKYVVRTVTACTGSWLIKSIEVCTWHGAVHPCSVHTGQLILPASWPACPGRCTAPHSAVWPL